MGDRTFVTIEIHKSHFRYDDVKLKDFPGIPHEDQDYINEVLADSKQEILSFGFDDINYGISDELIDFFSSKKIPFNYRWEAGSEYGAGDRFYRYCDKEKEMIHDEFYDEQNELYIFLKELDSASAAEKEKMVKERLKLMSQNNLDQTLHPCQKEKFIDALKDQ